MAGADPAAIPACPGKGLNEKDIDMDETRLMEFLGKAVEDVGAVLGGAMVVIGDKLGLYRALAGAGSLTPAELAARTGPSERYVREGLSSGRGPARASAAPASG